MRGYGEIGITGHLHCPVSRSYLDSSILCARGLMEGPPVSTRMYVGSSPAGHSEEKVTYERFTQEV